jgi:hypothetical protein
MGRSRRIPNAIKDASECEWATWTVFEIVERYGEDEARRIFAELGRPPGKRRRRTVGSLLKHTQRLHRTHPDHYCVVHFKVGGFSHIDPRVGWVSTPTFAVVGRQPKDSVAVPDTSPAADYQDEIPFS